ncbi:hypothetical protein [Labrys wisconsinensis]|uniref:Uncharacterized protein n=1 Tax=Labrys wisconsinensis TaxID=425677 RepID=A0ABU0JAM9_9HYPH|nr:hypothetical protein [Labrys wisconsinensis]MDQ0470596.1 hypothetical protein [Labrys wisconsinensis]
MFENIDALHDRLAAEDERHAALDHLLQAWEDAILDGIDGACVAHAALFTAFKELVATYGEEQVADFAQKLPERVRNGEFTLRGMAQ